MNLSLSCFDTMVPGHHGAPYGYYIYSSFDEVAADMSLTNGVRAPRPLQHHRRPSIGCGEEDGTPRHEDPGATPGQGQTKHLLGQLALLRLLEGARSWRRLGFRLEGEESNEEKRDIPSVYIWVPTSRARLGRLYLLSSTGPLFPANSPRFLKGISSL